jgi:amino acid transporter
MNIVIKIVGIVIVFLAALFLLKPDIMKSVLNFFKQGKRLYFVGLTRLVLAIVFLLAARECDITWVIVVFGILFLISGLSIFMIGAEKLRSMLDWFQNKSALFLRAMAVITLAIGAIIIYSA